MVIRYSSSVYFLDTYYGCSGYQVPTYFIFVVRLRMFDSWCTSLFGLLVYYMNLKRFTCNTYVMFFLDQDLGLPTCVLLRCPFSSRLIEFIDRLSGGYPDWRFVIRSNAMDPHIF